MNRQPPQPLAEVGFRKLIRALPGSEFFDHISVDPGIKAGSVVFTKGDWVYQAAVSHTSGVGTPRERANWLLRAARGLCELDCEQAGLSALEQDGTGE